MLLPYVEKATINLNKLADYVLNTNHPEGRRKARVFMSALGVTVADSEWLANAILTGLGQSEAVLQGNTNWGVDLPCRYGNPARASMCEGTNGLAMCGTRGKACDKLCNWRMR